ncbi:MAG TPA: rhodanese-like domain-containing protein [Cellvibrionaceae bacterium]|nr:rhodanese-like domain-containing protein [Cellvibrionaceae bacterium]HMW72892.1 rhodanese-like domain-containing protein [Cellvibrionaceae bacterium]HMY37959.1 rhodanese-like domain-containing protein [Marinagarivorans sp.]HNG59820.1 rhodanese-like domain-containing protein [Cellvibrionaceae bacterium]
MRNKILSIALASLFSLKAYCADIWIDVRSGEEFQAGHLPAAINIPHTEITQRISEVSKDKNDTIHLYCRSGRRSGLALEALQKAGYRQVINEGGYEDLVKKAKAP